MTVPTQGEDDQQGRKKVALLVLAALAMAALLAWMAFGGGDSKASPSPTSAASTPEVSAGSNGPGVGGGEASGKASKEPTEATPEPTFGNTPAPNPSVTYKGGDADENIKDEGAAPGFTPSSARKAESGDDAKAKQVIADVIPSWASNDTSEGNDLDHWSPQWQGSKSSHAASFRFQSQREYLSLWGGLSRMGVSALDAKIVSQEKLWNAGSHSLWRVTVKRSLKSNYGQSGLNSTEQVTWDILVKQDAGDEFKVANFADPKPANKKSKTFYLPEGIAE